MEIKVNNISEQEKELEIVVPWNMIKEDYNDILKKYSKLSFKGFRPGKAPVGVLESFFRNEIKNDLISVSSARLCRAALKKQGMEAGTPVEISEVESLKNDHLKFKAAFVEMPQFVLPDYYHLNLESEETEDKLNEISEKLLKQTQITLHSTFIENEMKYIDDCENLSEKEKNAAEDRVKLMLILKKIAGENNIEIDGKDIEERIKIVAAENDATPGELKEFLVNHNGLSRLSDSLLAETVLSFIIEAQS